MQKLRNGTLAERVPALNMSIQPPAPLTILSGSKFAVEREKLEWLGREGLYSDITLPDVPGCRFRVRHHQLALAVGDGPGVFKLKTVV